MSSRSYKGPAIGRMKRELITACYEGRCWICGNKPPALSLDHVIPRRRGGGMELRNLRPACPRCNGARDRRLRAMGSQAQREAIGRELGDTKHRAYPLPVFNEHGRVVWIAQNLADALPEHLLAHCRHAVVTEAVPA